MMTAIGNSGAQTWRLSIAAGWPIRVLVTVVFFVWLWWVVLAPGANDSNRHFGALCVPYDGIVQHPSSSPRFQPYRAGDWLFRVLTTVVFPRLAVLVQVYGNGSLFGLSFWRHDLFIWCWMSLISFSLSQLFWGGYGEGSLFFAIIFIMHCVAESPPAKITADRCPMRGGERRWQRQGPRGLRQCHTHRITVVKN